MTSRQKSALGILCFLAVFIAIMLWQSIRRMQAGDALIAAIHREDTSSALAALRTGADPSCQDRDHAPHSFSRYLLDRWRQIRSGKPALIGHGPSALALAVEKNNPEIVKALIAAGARDTGEKLRPPQGADLTPSPCSLLMYAASRDNPTIIRALAASGSDVNARNEIKETALFYCRGATAVPALAACGASRDAKDAQGYTALDAAIRSHTQSVSQALIAAGAKDSEAISVAVEYRNPNMLKIMLQLGWDPNTKDADGWSPLLEAADSAAHLEPEAALLLIRSGADVHFRNGNDFTPLFLAADGGRYPPMDDQSLAVVKALLDKGARINARDYRGMTPLMNAAWNYRPALVRLLMKRGAAVNVRDKTGNTILSLARMGVLNRRAQPDEQAMIIRMLKAASTRD